ncbi:MAG: hypothetical protein SFZ03_07245 [Candidatus Melainabacteria bacterium]|nr:hypothetical protein [Candidatus Melainabacteria bacterium]
MAGLWPGPGTFPYSPWNARVNHLYQGGIQVPQWWGTMPATNQNNRFGWTPDGPMNGGLYYDILEQSMRDQNAQYTGNITWYVNGGPLNPNAVGQPPVNMRDVDPFGSLFDYRLSQTKVELMSNMATEAEIISTMQGLIEA